MKKPYAYEAVATCAGIVGAFVLVSGLMPFLNPGLVELHQAGAYSPRITFLLPTLLSLPILGLAWHFNKKAQEIRRELKTTSAVEVAPWQRKLKWVLFGVVVLLVLYAFLW